MPSSRDRSRGGRGFHAFVGSGIPARHTALYILYLLLASGVFGASLLYHRLLLARCQDAIDLSQSASSILERYGSMDGTKTAEFRASLKGTVTQVLDDKLPMVISRACNQMHIFHLNSALQWAIEVFFGCHIICVVIMHAKVWKPWWKDQAARIASGEFEEDSRRALTEVAFLDSMACGLTMGYEIAVSLNVLLHISYFTSSVSTDFDPFELLVIQGLLFSLLLVIGALASASWPSEHNTIHRSQYQDVEMGLP
ncbi:MAG: hypothetical protein LQ337_002006 [Flavoplaca oasis]|nr:MAG: hypothetical protein LQ337_002006 [Flavoplaca oasis]